MSSIAHSLVRMATTELSPYYVPPVDSREPKVALRPLYIFDLDFTLCDPSHRSHFINEQEGATPDWRGFFAACTADTPVPAVITTAQVLKAAGAEVHIWTGRSDEVRDLTVEWLYTHRVPYHGLRMRRAGDTLPDRILKGGWLADMAAPDRERLTAVFDDNAGMVAFWRSMGVPCFQVRDSAY